MSHILPHLRRSRFAPVNSRRIPGEEWLSGLIALPAFAAFSMVNHILFKLAINMNELCSRTAHHVVLPTKICIKKFHTLHLIGFMPSRHDLEVLFSTCNIRATNLPSQKALDAKTTSILLSFRPWRFCRRINFSQYKPRTCSCVSRHANEEAVRTELLLKGNVIVHKCLSHLTITLRWRRRFVSHAILFWLRRRDVSTSMQLLSSERRRIACCFCVRRLFWGKYVDWSVRRSFSKRKLKGAGYLVTPSISMISTCVKFEKICGCRDYCDSGSKAFP